MYTMQFSAHVYRYNSSLVGILFQETTTKLLRHYGKNIISTSYKAHTHTVYWQRRYYGIIRALLCCWYIGHSDCCAGDREFDSRSW